MITTGNFPKALVGGPPGKKEPKKKMPQPKLSTMYIRKGKRGS